MLPDVVTHYHRATRDPFLNLSDLDGDLLDRVLRDLEEERRTGESARVFGRRYMELRRRTESRLRSLFVAAGGRPQRSAPHYFVLGSSPWYEGVADDIRGVTVAVADLPSHVTSVTYPDSFTAMGLGPEYGLPYQARPYHGRVFRLEELPQLVEAYGLPSDDGPGPDGYHGYHRRDFETYIEVQLWSDAPLRALGLCP